MMNLQKQLQQWGMDIPNISEKMHSGLSSDTTWDKETMRTFLIQILTAESHRYDTYDPLAVKLLTEEHEEKTVDDYIEVVSRLQQNRDLNGNTRPLLEKGFYEFILQNEDKIRSIFKHVQKTSSVFHMTVFGWKTLLRSYLMKNHEGVVERPDHLWFRVALFIHRDHWDNVENTFRCLRQGYFIHATPTLFSAGTIKSQMASCFVAGTPVLTNKGWIPIENVQIGQLTRSHQGIWQKIVQLHKNPLNERKLYSLKIGLSSSSLVVTDNHPFYVYDEKSSTYVWKSTDLLKEGDWIVSVSRRNIYHSSDDHERRGLLWTATGLDMSCNVFIKKSDFLHARRLLRNMNYKVIDNPSHYIHLEISPLEIDVTPPRSILLSYRDENLEAFLSFLRGIQLTSRWKQKNDDDECKIRLRTDHYYFSLIYDLGDLMSIHKIPCIINENQGYHELSFKMPTESSYFTIENLWNKFWYQKEIGDTVLWKLRSKVLTPSSDEYVYTLGVENDHSYTVDNVVVKNCFLVGTDDSVEGIYRTISDCAQISKWAGGLGIHISNIRGKNSYIYGTNGTSNGIMPMLKVYNDTARYIDQCFSGDTKIFTNRGLIPIREIRTYTDRVLTKNGKFERVLKKLIYTKNGNDDDIVSVTMRTPWGSTESVLMMGSHNMMMKGNLEIKMKSFVTAGFSSTTCYYPLQDLIQVDWTDDYCRVLGYIYRHMQKRNLCSFSLSLPDDTVFSEMIINFFKDYYPFHLKKIDDGSIQLDLENCTIDRPHVIDIDRIDENPDYREIPSMFLFVSPISKTRSFLEGWYGQSFDRYQDFYYKYRELFTKQATLHGTIVGVHKSRIDNKNHHFYDLEIENEHNYHTIMGLAHNGGGKRNGAFAIYLEPWHCDIFEFLEAKRNIGNEEDRARDLFYALWIPDLFMEKVEKGEDWFLMSPRQSPDLEKVWGDEFNRLYNEYVSTNRFVRRVPARDVWREILRSQIETGTPYMLYKDTCNRHSNQQNIGTIRSSNLCCEIIQYSDHTEYAVCNLASIALPKCVITPKLPSDTRFKIYGKPSCIYCKLLQNILKDRRILFQYMDIKECPDTIRSMMQTVPIVVDSDNHLIGGFQETWEKFLTPVFDFEKLGHMVETLVENLNIVIDKNDYPIEQCRKSNLRHRPMGIGVQGLADVFFMLMLPYDSDGAKALNRRIFETMYYHAIKKSCVMAQKYGVYDSFYGSPLSNGKFHFEFYPSGVSTTMNWESLREEVMTHGVRNSLFIAPMPTASTSQILGNTESFEPLTSNLYLRRTSAGEFYVCNSYLRKLLMMMNLWDDDMLDMMIVYKGSIQKIDKIPSLFKNIFRTVWEIPQKSLLLMASERQWFIDQSQSMNVYLTDPDLEKLTKIHFYGWKKLLKTGSYYVRARASNSSQNFTIDPKKEQDLLCVSCTA